MPSILRQVPENTIAFGTVAHIAGGGLIDVQLDRGGYAPAVEYMGAGFPAVGAKAMLAWDALKSTWVVVSTIAPVVDVSQVSNGDTSGLSLFDLTDVPNASGNVYLKHGANGLLSWETVTYDIPDVTFLDLVDTPSLYGAEGDVLTVGPGASALVFTTPSWLYRVDVLVSSPLTKSNGVDSRQFTLGLDPSGISHSTLGSLESDDHLQYATVASGRSAYMAENLNRSLTASGTDGIRVDGGTSRQLNTNAAISFVADDIADNSRAIVSTGNKLGIDLAATSGLSISSGKLSIWDGIAGNGLAIASKVLSVGQGNGISVSADSVAVNQAYAFSWTANHSWTANLHHPDYASQTSRWRISSLGEADFRYLFADEMHVKVFVADLEQALAGAQIIAKSVAVLAQDFTVPAAGSTAYLYVEDLPSAQNMAVFEVDDVVVLRSFSRNDGSLVVGNAWGTVESYTDGNGANGIPEGQQRWLFRRSVAPNAGALSAGTVINADSLVLDFGKSGNGYHEVNAIDGRYAANSPYSQVVTWSGHPATGQTVRTRTGNLKGLAFPEQPDNEYGFYAGDGRQAHNKYIRVSTWGSELHNMPLRLYDQGVATVSIDPNFPAIAIGANADLVTYDGSSIPGFYVGKRPVSGHYVFRIGNDSQYIKWTGTTLEVSGVIHVHEGSDLEPKRYRMVQVDFNWISVVAVGTTSVRLIRNGSLVNGEGYRFWFAPVVAGELRTVIEKTGQEVVAYVFKNGTGYAKTSAPFGDEAPSCNGLDNIDYENPNTHYVDVCFETRDKFYDNAFYSQLERDNIVVIGTLRMSSDFTRVEGLFGRAESASTIIGPGYINTVSLSAISAYLGEIISGSIEVGTTNKLWLNVGNDTLKFAVGGTIRNEAPFRVWEDGKFRVGDASRYLQYDALLGLDIKGNISADSGYLGALSITGNLSVNNPGKISWANGDGFLDQLGIYYAEKVGSSLAAVLRVGRYATVNGVPVSQGMIDVDMFAEADSQWDYAIHVTDGGNSNNSYSALYHGQSAVSGTGAVDRIFNAYTTNASYSDGYYSDLAAGLWADFDSSGVSFKGISRGGQPVAVFQQAGSEQNGPVVFAGSDQIGRAVYWAEIAQSGQVAFHVDQNGMGPNSFLALNANGGKVSMGQGDIESIGQITFKLGGGVTGTSAMVSGSAGWIRVWLDGDNRNFFIPLYTNGTTH